MSSAVKHLEAFETFDNHVDKRIMEVVREVMVPVMEWMELGKSSARKGERKSGPTLRNRRRSRTPPTTVPSVYRTCKSHHSAGVLGSSASLLGSGLGL
jgi:hypothetical protein